MKRNLHLSWILSVLLPFWLNAQNHITENHSHNTIQSEQEFKHQFQKTDSAYYFLFAPDREISDSGKAHHSFRIIINGAWSYLAITNGDDFVKWFDYPEINSDTIDVLLPEGIYDMLVSGDKERRYRFLGFDNIAIEEDAIFEIRMSDAKNRVRVNPVDEDGIPFSQKKLLSYYPAYSLYHHSGLASVSVLYSLMTSFSQAFVYVNDISSHFRVNMYFAACDRNGAEYGIRMPAVMEGLDSDTTLSYPASDIMTTSHLFNLPTDLNYCAKGTLVALTSLQNNFVLGGSSTYQTFDPSQPCIFHTNSKISDIKGDINVFFSPYIITDNWSNYYWNNPCIYSAPMIIGKNGNLLRDDFIDFQSNFLFYWPEDFNNVLSRADYNYQYEQGELIRNGFRTPHLYHQAFCYNANNSPTGKTFFTMNFLYQGENNERRSCDEDILIHVRLDDEMIYSDSLWSFMLQTWEVDPEVVTMNMTNDKVFAYGRKMINTAEVMSDLSQEDAIPPTLTMLRIVDETGKTTIGVEDMSEVRMELSAGDFYRDRAVMKYGDRPEIDVSWSIDGEVFYPLQAVEDEARFHKSSGNFFTVDLASLKNHDIQDQWIIVKITITDAAGNYQTQTLDPLFYCGKLVDIEALSADSIKHSVFPNPFTENITVALEEPLKKVAYFEVYDLSGRIVHQQKTPKQTSSFSWNGNYLKEGVYIYAIYSEEGSAKGKVVKR